MIRTKTEFQNSNLNSVQKNKQLNHNNRIQTMKTTHKLRQRVQALFGMLMVFAVVLGTSSDFLLRYHLHLHPSVTRQQQRTLIMVVTISLLLLILLLQLYNR